MVAWKTCQLFYLIIGKVYTTCGVLEGAVVLEAWKSMIWYCKQNETL